MEKELSPNTGKSMQDIIDNKKVKTLPKKMHDIISNVLKEFNYGDKNVVDITRYVLDSDIDTALEDCIPMKVFFGMCGNKYEEKEEIVNEKIKIYLGQAIGNKEEKITAQKGKLKNTEHYKKLVARKLQLTRLKKDCRTLEEAMVMRKDVSQTKSANFRGSAGTYINRR